MWKRLEKLGQVLQHQNIQYPMIILQPGETAEQLPAKIERWKAGEKVEGINGEYEGGDVGIVLPFEFVEPGDK
jgi:hypothetical protein